VVHAVLRCRAGPNRDHSEKITTEHTEDHGGKPYRRAKRFLMATACQRGIPEINQITGRIIAAAMKVHSELGPGLLESAYHACLLHELRKQGLAVASQVGLPVVYDGQRIELGYRIDMLVENVVIVEVKSVEAINPVHQAQLLSYLRLSGKGVGLLINFHMVHLRDGIKRMVDGENWRGSVELQRPSRGTE
jgi:GxxExxY protein